MELWQSAEKDSDGSASLGVLITGSSGVGKTQLAVSIFSDHAISVDLRIWVQSASRASVIEAFVEAAEYIQVPTPDGAGPDAKAAALLNWLAVTNKSWFIVFDNVANPAELRGLWPKGSGRFLATTYRQDAALLTGIASCFPLNVFAATEAQEYVERRLLKAGHGEAPHVLAAKLKESEALVRDLGRLPVALAQAVSVIIYQAISCRDYRKDFADRARRLSDLFPEGLPADEYERTVATTWSLAMQQAEESVPQGLAACIARLVALTDPDGVPEAFFYAEPAIRYMNKVMASPSPEGDTKLAVEVSTVRAALRTLHSLSLIEHQASGAGRVRMHALTQRALQETLSLDTLRNMGTVVAESIADLLLKADRRDLLDLASNLATLNTIVPDIFWVDRPHDSLFLVGLYLLEAGFPAAAISHFEWVVAEAGTRLSQHASDNLALRTQLGIAYQTKGDVAKAIALLQEIAKDAEDGFGKNHRLSLSARNNLATAYHAAGNTSATISILKGVIIDAEDLSTVDDHESHIYSNNLASAYQEIGELTTAIPLLENTLAEVLQNRGDAHPDTLTSRSNLASALLDAGNLEVAIPLLLRVVVEAEQMLGKDHPFSVSCRSNLGSAYQQSGDVRTAIAILKPALSDAVRLLGRDHPITLSCGSNLGTAYTDAGKPQRAIKVLTQTLKDSQRVLSDTHPNILTCRNNLAVAYLEDKRPDLAITILEKTLDDAERVFGDDHPGMMRTRGNLASAYTAADRLEEATKLYERNIRDRDRVLGADHPDTFHAKNNLAGALFAAGRLADAFSIVKTNLAECERKLGREHPITLTSRNNLANLYMAAGNHHRAIPILEQVADDFERLLGSDHPKSRASRETVENARLLKQVSGSLPPSVLS